MGPAPEVAAVRQAVRAALAEVPLGWVAVGCSGGADSTALVAATIFEARHTGHQVVAIVVDHGLQESSAEVAERVADRVSTLGADDCRVVRVEVGGEGGPEASARRARYAALSQQADEYGAQVILLGHTRDDQAESVLLGLARGSGTRSLSGMAPVAGRFLRPLLDLGRAATYAACEAEGLAVWEDPHNADDAYTRSRIRNHVMPLLEEHLGPGFAEALARTARLARQDADLLDAQAESALVEVSVGPGRLSVPATVALPSALRSRVLRKAVLNAGARPTELALGHVDAVDALLSDWHGQTRVDLPGRLTARRAGDALIVEQTSVAG